MKTEAGVSFNTQKSKYSFLFFNSILVPFSHSSVLCLNNEIMQLFHVCKAISSQRFMISLRNQSKKDNAVMLEHKGTYKKLPLYRQADPVNCSWHSSSHKGPLSLAAPEARADLQSHGADSWSWALSDCLCRVCLCSFVLVFRWWL